MLHQPHAVTCSPRHGGMVQACQSSKLLLWSGLSCECLIEPRCMAHLYSSGGGCQKWPRSCALYLCLSLTGIFSQGFATNQQKASSSSSSNYREERKGKRGRHRFGPATQDIIMSVSCPSRNSSDCKRGCSSSYLT